MKRSNKPVFWSLFGAGGMLSALVGPALVFLTGIALPLGLGFDAAGLSYARAMGLLQNPLAALALAAVISLFLFHGFHRLYHTLHDLGVPVGPGLKALCHGLARLGTLVAIALLFALG
ncbi:MAG: fumarate reductase subunit FrdD [Gammaproteobacteria bacterium]|nr:fumarate reductase subunit FrdD [Gammaproteobacteria bacterium]